MQLTTRIIIITLFFAFGVFCIVKGTRSRPYKLKKASVSMKFRKNLPHELGQPLEILRSKKTELIGTVIWAVVGAASFLYWLWDDGNLFYVAVSFVAAFYTFWLSSRKLVLYDNAVVLKAIVGGKTWFLDEIDVLQSYNIVNSFNRGVSYGYKLMRGDEVVYLFPKGAFENIDHIEEVYRQSPYLDEIEEGEL